MAEGIFRVLTEKYDLKDVACTSCGLAAYPGMPPTSYAVRAAEKYGANIVAHRARALTEYLLEEGDLFVCMTQSHADALKPYLPAEKICVLGGGIPDPYGGTMETYRDCAAAIYDALEAWIQENQAQKEQEDEA